MKSAEEMATFSQGNLEAVMRSSQIFVSGLQEMAQQAAASAQQRMEEAMNAFRAMSQVRSIKEAVELHSSFTRSSMETAVSQGGQVADATYKLAEQTMAPLTQRFSLAAETLTRA